MTEADVQNTASADLRHSLAAMLSAQGDGPPLWRDLRLFRADAMIGFDGRGCVLLRLAKQGERPIIFELPLNDARSLIAGTTAAVGVAEAALAAEMPAA